MSGVPETPTGSSDPYALRRNALGLVRSLRERGIRLGAQNWAYIALERALGFRRDIAEVGFEGVSAARDAVLAKHFGVGEAAQLRAMLIRSGADLTYAFEELKPACTVIAWDILAFLADRLKVQLRDQGKRHDLVDAVFALGGQDDLLMVVRRVEALGKFLDTDDGKNLLAGTKRAANILRIEEKKDGKAHDGAPDAALYSLDEEKTLAKAIDQVTAEASAAVAKEDFAAAMSAMAKLRPAVDAFFDKVKVNDDDARVRENRLKLLNEIRAATRAVANFSRIQD